MSRRDRKYGRGGRGPLTPRRGVDAAYSAVPELATLIPAIAVSVEACRSIQRAVTLGAIGGSYVDDDVIAPDVLALIPRSRGGTLDGPEVETDWMAMVRGLEAEAVARGAEDVEAQRRRFDEIERMNGGAS